MRIAIIGANHWHVPLYLDALEADQAVQVVAVSDETETRGPLLATRFGASRYVDWRQLLDREAIDLAFVFGRHEQMHEIASDLIMRGIPFAIEKPAGLSRAQVQALLTLASSRNHFVAVPLIFGFSNLIQHLHSVAEPAEWRHMSFRFIAGPISRYRAAHCDWMLDANKAGGGCTINLAAHLIDIFTQLTGGSLHRVSARMIRDPSVSDVEIYSILTMESEAGQLCTIETGYTYPGGTQQQREFSFSLSSERGHVQSTIGGLRMTPNNGRPTTDIPMDLNTDIYYGEFVRRTLQELRDQRTPAAGLRQMTAIMGIIDCAYESDRNRGAVVEPVPLEG